jgi:hypothetical protein
MGVQQAGNYYISPALIGRSVEIFSQSLVMQSYSSALGTDGIMGFGNF